MEVQQKSTGQASPASPTLFCFKVTSLDFDWTRTRLTVEFGQVHQILLEVQWTVRWVCRNWLGLVKVHWNLSEKGGECKVHKESEKAREENKQGRFTAALLNLLKKEGRLETLTYTDILKYIKPIKG